MYLKTLEMNGFKSFADKTRLDFEPGITAVVGPNGCGKSNVSDAIRWVLGEQSAKAMRGSSMEDCIFNGTDTRKPMGMAEVSMTLAECESVLSTEFNEVTVSRRVFRSGEGQYFINKTPCRLRDIQRLFMDTGIGTTSYSVMEQGRIDRVLSSRPEDRRTVFEEASGITKYKADKKEALRKLEHTEANLLRLADVIREVKRQIGSLQRQAGKARRYKELRDELRRLDLFLARHRLTQSDQAIATSVRRLAEMTRQVEEGQAGIKELEQDTLALRDSLAKTDREIAAVHEARVQAQGGLDHARELVRLNGQRIEEYRAWTQRDQGEMSETTRQIEDSRTRLASLETKLAETRREYDSARQLMAESEERVARHTRELDQARTQVQKLRQDSIELESLAARLQNTLVEIESRERASILQRERLAAEKSQTARTVAGFEERMGAVGKAVAELREQATAAENALRELDLRRTERVALLKKTEAETAETRSRLAGATVQAQMLSKAEQSHEGLSGGYRALTDTRNPLKLDASMVLGPLAQRLDAEPRYRIALEAALRAWSDAVLVADPAAGIALLERLLKARVGAARLVAMHGDETPASLPPVEGDRLLDHVRCDADIRPAIERMLGRVVVVPSLAAAPRPMPPLAVFVTQKGALMRDDGCMEYWMAEPQAPSPLARKHALAEAQGEVAALTARAEELAAQVRSATDEIAAMDRAVGESRGVVASSARALAQREGENDLIAKEARDARQRLETVSWELDQLASEVQTGSDERKQVVERLAEVRAQKDKAVSEMHTCTGALRDLELRHSQSHAELTERKVFCEGLRHSVENLDGQRASLATRARELQDALDGRSRGVLGYQQAIASLEKANSEAEASMASLSAQVGDCEARSADLGKNRDKQARELAEMEQSLASRHDALDALRQSRSEVEVSLAESRMRRQNILDRSAADWGASIQNLQDAQEPEWPEKRPGWDEIETSIAELHTKIEAMGPVNLVAIEEYGELEERFAFLSNQDRDLVNAKQQLVDLIRKINKTTSDLFAETFTRINENFDAMFRKLFNGGTAKLVLVNEEDILECGIEIIARPPGKKLQNISLLSGGERTLTAVALLFAIYMIKPSPFCILDELDAPLDDSNIGRFIEALQGFLTQSQFVLITHSQHTISAANVLYGVTMAEKGVSRIMSMKLPREQTAAVI